MSRAVAKIHYVDQRKAVVNPSMDNIYLHIYTTNKNTDALIDIIKEGGLELNAQKGNYYVYAGILRKYECMSLSRH
jgi:hypothetical protein